MHLWNEKGITKNCCLQALTLQNFEGMLVGGEGGGVRRTYLTNREACALCYCKVCRNQLEQERSVGKNTKHNQMFLPTSLIIKSVLNS